MPRKTNNAAMCLGCLDVVHQNSTCHCGNLYVGSVHYRRMRTSAIGYEELAISVPTFAELMQRRHIYVHEYIGYRRLRLRHMATTGVCRECRSAATFAYREGRSWVWLCTPHCANRHIGSETNA